MALVRFKKIQILGHEQNQASLLSTLQDLGIVQLTKTDKLLTPFEIPATELGRINNRLNELENGIKTLGLFEEKKTRLLQSLFKPRLIFKEGQIEKTAFSGEYKKILSEIEERQEEIKRLKSQAQRFYSEYHLLYPWHKLELKLENLIPTLYTHTFLGVVSQANYTLCLEAINSENLSVFLHTISQDRKERYLIVVCLNKHKERVEAIMRQYNFGFFILPEYLRRSELRNTRISQCLDIFKEKIEEIEYLIENEVARIRKIIPRKAIFLGLYDYFFNQRSLFWAGQNLGQSQKVFLLEGWIREEDLETLSNTLHRFCEIEIFSRGALPGEEIPVDLENKAIFKPFEAITSLYGMPARYSVDPTPYLAPFFFIFFGLCLSDAGYGLIVAGASFFLLRRLKWTRAARRFLNLFFLCGISTIVAGTFMGGWLGIPIKRLLFFDPMKNPLIFLLIALGLGFIQVWFGILIRMVHEINQRAFVDAFFVRLAWLLLLPSLILVFMKINWVGYLAITAAISIVLFSHHQIKNILTRIGAGLYSLYGIMGYFADVVSYSRLLALGLCTSVIAMVVNTLSKSALGIPVIGLIVAVLVFIGGHLFNMAISLLGAFVHSARLQFIEFFNKFFVGGGRPFRPFCRERIYG